MEQLNLLFGTFLLQQGNLDEAISALESIQKPTLALSLLSVKAYQEKQEPGKVESLTRAACDEALKSIGRYTCTKCQATADEWAENCPSCQTWDTLALGTSLRA